MERSVRWRARRSSPPATCASTPRRPHGAPPSARGSTCARSPRSPSSTRARSSSPASGRTTASRRRPTSLLRALVHAGNFVAGAFDGDRLVGVSLGFWGLDDDELHVHSHITGIDRPFQGRSLGFALKQFQRSWALERGARTVVWTADPLVRGNAYFNLVKLGAAMVAYHENFYGVLEDGLNSGDSDRVVLRWDLASDRAVRAADGALDEPAAPGGRVVLRAGPDFRPVTDGARGDRLLAWVPEDIVRVREEDPELARAWRRALRDTVGARPRRRVPRRGDHARRLARAAAMRLEGVELRRVRLPLVAPFRTSFGTERDRDILLVRAVGPDGDGWGECVAFSEPFYSSEYVDGAHDVIRRHLLPRLFARGEVAAEDVASCPRRCAATRWRRRRSRWRSSTPSCAPRASRSARTSARCGRRSTAACRSASKDA